MRKIYALLKHSKYVLAFLVLTIVVINACKKDKKNLPLTKLELIAEARNYFEDEVVNVPQLNDNNLRHSLDKTPLWDKASTRKISIGEAVIVPIKYEQKIKIGYEESTDKEELEKTSYLMIYKDKEQSMQVEWVTLLPTARSNGKKFVGSLVIEHWNGKFKRGYAIGDDEEVFPIEPTGSNIFKKIAYKRREYCITINHYGYLSVGGYNGPMQFLGSESLCFGTANNGETQKTSVNNDGSTGPEDYTYTIDCAKVINGTAYWNYGCNTCMGGTTGITECPKEVAVDPDARDCLKKIKRILDSLGLNSTDTSINLIAKVLNKLNLTKAVNFNAIIKEGQVSASNHFAETYAPNLNSNLWGTQGLVSEIRFNSSSLNKATDLAIVTAMMHEYIHAYFMWNMHLMERSSTYDNDFRDTYNLLFDKSG